MAPGKPKNNPGMDAQPDSDPQKRKELEQLMNEFSATQELSDLKENMVLAQGPGAPEAEAQQQENLMTYATQLRDYIGQYEEFEDIAKMDMTEWFELFSNLNKNIPVPAELKGRDKETMQWITDRYGELFFHPDLTPDVDQNEHLGYRMIKAQNDLIAAMQEGAEKLDATELRGYLRDIALYMEKFYVYNKRYSGDERLGKVLPAELARLVQGDDREIAEGVSRRVLAKVLNWQYDVFDDIGIDAKKIRPMDISGKTSQLVVGATTGQMALSKVLDLIVKGEDGDEVTSNTKDIEQFILDCGLTEKQSKDPEYQMSARYFIGYIKKYLPRIKQNAKMQNVEITAKDYSVFNALQSCPGSPIASSIMGEIEKQMNQMTIKDLLPPWAIELNLDYEKIFNDAKNYPEATRKEIMGHLIELIEKDPRAKGLEKGELLRASETASGAMLTNEAATIAVLNRKSILGYLEDNSQYLVVEKMVDSLCTQEQADRILRLMRIDPNDKNDGVDGPVIKAVNDLIVGQEMSLREAYQLYFILNSSSSEIMTPFFVVKMLKSSTRPKYHTSAQYMHDHVVSHTIGLAGKTAKEIADDASDMEISDETATELRNLSRYAYDKGWGFVPRMYHWYMSKVHSYPYPMHTLHAIIAARVGIEAARAIMWNKIWELSAASNSEDDLKAWAKKNLGLTESDPNYKQKLRMIGKLAADAKTFEDTEVSNMRHKSYLWRTKMPFADKINNNIYSRIKFPHINPLRLPGALIGANGILERRRIRLQADAVVQSLMKEGFDLKAIAQNLRSGPNPVDVDTAVSIMYGSASESKVKAALTDAGYQGVNESYNIYKGAMESLGAESDADPLTPGQAQRIATELDIDPKTGKPKKKGDADSNVKLGGKGG